MCGWRLEYMVIKAGVIGLSTGNGHPFSFSAIINGYNKSAFLKSGWNVIYDYLETKTKDNFGINDVRVTHAWTQDKIITKQLCEACKIENNCSSIDEMYNQIDALIVARDDWNNHKKYALPFLKKKIPVFVDKPLTLDLEELNTFKSYILQNKLMSCSGFRFSSELDSLRDLNITKNIKLINGTVLNDLEKYGIHILDAIAGIGISFKHIKTITRLNSTLDSFTIILKNNIHINLYCLGKVAKTFHMSIFTKNFHKHYDLHDNFEAFRRTLINFFNMVKYNSLSFDPLETIYLMELMIKLKKLNKGETLFF